MKDSFLSRPALRFFFVDHFAASSSYYLKLRQVRNIPQQGNIGGFTSPSAF